MLSLADVKKEVQLELESSASENENDVALPCSASRCSYSDDKLLSHSRESFKDWNKFML